MRYRNGFALGLVVLMMVAFMGAAPATAAEQFISGGLQIHAFNFQSKADVEYEIPDGKFAIGGQDIGGTKIDGDVDYKTDTTIGFALGYTYISPEDWFLGGELIFANYKGEFKGDLKGDFKGNDIKYDVKSDAEIKSTRIGALGGYYFKPKPLRPYVMGGLGLNLNELDIE
ncbi:outer membrane beta-barrel protein, partial [bacterium]|nr:outer membrane beta-barrel protein [bacterium]